MLHSHITGVGAYVPERCVTNDELSQRVATSDAWIRERTGIGSRHIAADNEAASDLALQAARRAMAVAGCEAVDLDMILVATVTGDRPLPSTAALLQRKLDRGLRCAAVDLQAACAGFLYGLSIADALLRTGAHRRILLVGVEVLSRFVDWEDRSTCVLFGDGAGAVVLEARKAPGGVRSTHLGCQGDLADLLTIPAGGSATPAAATTVADRGHFVRMQGRDVFRVAVKELASICMSAIEANRLSGEHLDWVVAHQANERILEAVSKRCGIPFERFVRNIERFGNTSSASIPIALDEAFRDGRLEAGQNLLMCALGAGIAWGAAVVEWSLPTPSQGIGSQES